MTPDASYLTSAEVAGLCRVHIRTVRRWHKDGKLRAVELPSGRLRFRREDVDAMFEAAEPAPAALAPTGTAP